MVVALVASIFVLGACSAGGEDSTSESVAPASSVVAPEGAGVVPEGFTAVTLVVTRADGSTEEWCVWLADDQAERGRGLMFVTDPDLGGKDGMVFVFPGDSRASFYMKNTLLALSIAYIGADGRVVSTTDMEPCPADSANCPLYPAGGPYRLALEVPKGGLSALGITDDSRVSLGAAAC